MLKTLFNISLFDKSLLFTWLIPAEFTRAIDEEGDPEGPKYRINPEKLKAACRADIVTNPDLLHIQDWDDLDSSDCDNIIQVLLFGKTIYG